MVQELVNITNTKSIKVGGMTWKPRQKLPDIPTLTPLPLEQASSLHYD